MLFGLTFYQLFLFYIGSDYHDVRTGESSAFNLFTARITGNCFGLLLLSNHLHLKWLYESEMLFYRLPKILTANTNRINPKTFIYSRSWNLCLNYFVFDLLALYFLQINSQLCSATFFIDSVVAFSA